MERCVVYGEVCSVWCGVLMWHVVGGMVCAVCGVCVWRGV